ncbi:MAG: CDP-diacylglycerol--serine O-phosphatidyltransferase [Hyphomicrobiales bacterium]|nr:CDP-diacylglycerol--serine O-phosphatidyltransferase [Hyphomicrobiales bacterium]
MGIERDELDMDTGSAPLNGRRRRRFSRIPMRIVLPNLVTLLAICLGLTSIRFAAEAKFEMAAVFIVCAAVLDGLDGRLARALDGASRFGAELDSLADFVDFGVAPAFLLYFWSLHQAPSFGWFAAMVFAIAAALRLARFNVMIDDPNKPAWHAQFFVGMPAPAGAICAMLPIYLKYSVVGLPEGRLFTYIEIAYVIAIAFLMVSRIPHFSGKQIGRVPRDWFIPVLFAVAALVLLLATFPMEVLVGLTLAYLAMVPLAMRRHRAMTLADEASAAALLAPEGARKA